MARARASRGEVAQSASNNANLQKMMGAMKFQTMLRSAGKAVSQEEIQELNAALQNIAK